LENVFTIRFSLVWVMEAGLDGAGWQMEVGGEDEGKLQEVLRFFG
jgi:hypothetical protein